MNIGIDNELKKAIAVGLTKQQAADRLLNQQPSQVGLLARIFSAILHGYGDAKITSMVRHFDADASHQKIEILIEYDQPQSSAEH